MTYFIRAACMGMLPVILTMVLTGCAGQSQTASHYLLKPLDRPAHAESAAGNERPLRISVGPVEFPRYLDRPQLVSLNPDNQVAIDEFHRWAEPLKENFTRVLMENLSLLLHTDYVYRFSAQNKGDIDYHVLIQIHRFNAVSGQKAELIAFWQILLGEDRTLVDKKKLVLTQPLNTDENADVVLALNDTLTQFSQNIAETLQSLSGTAGQGAGPEPVLTQKAASPRAAPGGIEILDAWHGDYPASKLDLLPSEQQEQPIGFIDNTEIFQGVWQAFMPDNDLPPVDFQTDLVLFTRNTQFYNRIMIRKVNVTNGVAEVLAMETLSARPIEDHVAMSMVAIPRTGIDGLKNGDAVIPIPAVSQ